MTNKELHDLALYYENTGRRVDAEQVLLRAIQQGSKSAFNDLGVLHQRNHEYEAALNCFSTAMSYNVKEAYRNIGELYEYGDGVEFNFKKAMDYYLKGIKLKEIDCYYKLYKFYKNGYVGVRDINKAKGYLLNGLKVSLRNKKTSSDACVIEVAYQKMYGGPAFEVNAKEGAKILKKALKIDSPQIYYNLGCAYNCGTGVKVNKKKAIELFKKAASKGYQDAFYQLALVHIANDSGYYNPHIALHYFMKGINHKSQKTAILLAEACFSKSEDPIMYNLKLGKRAVEKFNEFTNNNPDSTYDDVWEMYEKLKENYPDSVDYAEIEKTYKQRKMEAIIKYGTKEPKDLIDCFYDEY